MTKHYFLPQLKYHLVTQKKKQQQGFSFIETMVAMTILSIAFAMNLQFLVLLKIENINQEIKTGAVSLSKEILDGLRYQFRDNFTSTLKFRNTTINNTGATTFQLTDTEKTDFGGYKYKVTVNICLDKPTIDPTTKSVTSCTTTGTANNRYMVLQIFSPNINTNTNTNEQVYVLETTFTTLQK